MTKLVKATVNDSWMASEGLGWFVSYGEPRTIDGTPMVQLGTGLFPAKGWHADEHAAILEAADKIQAIAQRLAKQADGMRVKALQLRDEASQAEAMNRATVDGCVT